MSPRPANRQVERHDQLVPTFLHQFATLLMRGIKSVFVRRINDVGRLLIVGNLLRTHPKKPADDFGRARVSARGMMPAVGFFLPIIH
jgi:hypothetical protein